MRPSRSASLASVSSSLNLLPSSPRSNWKLQPLCSKSSAPPGSSNTPSIDTNSVTTTLLIIPPLRALSSFLTTGPLQTHRRIRSSPGEAPVDLAEERRPALAGALVRLGRHLAGLLEVHLGALVAGLGELDRAELVQVLRRVIPHGEDEALGFLDLEVLAVPVDLATPDEHCQAPPATRADIHRDRLERDLRVGAIPVGEALGLGPLPPQLVARGVEHPANLEPGLLLVARGRRLRHGGPLPRRADGRFARSPPPRTGGSGRSTRRPSSAGAPRGVPGGVGRG